MRPSTVRAMCMGCALLLCACVRVGYDPRATPEPTMASVDAGRTPVMPPASGSRDDDAGVPEDPRDADGGERPAADAGATDSGMPDAAAADAAAADAAAGDAATSVPDASAPPTPPTSAWKFDEAAGATAADSAGAKPLTQTNGTWVAGKTGNGLNLNGTNAFAASTGPLIDTAASYSVAAWVRLDALTASRTIFSQDGTTLSAFSLQFSQGLGNTFAFIIHDADTTSSSPTRAVSTTTAVAGQWYHLVAVRDKVAGTMKLFVNGQLEATTAFTGGWATSGNFTLGRAKWMGPIEWFAGTVDEARVYTTALTDADVTALFSGS